MRRTVLGLEPLGERITPTSLVVRNGVLIAIGGCYADTLRVSCEDGVLYATLNQRSLSVPEGWVHSIVARMGASADYVEIDQRLLRPTKTSTLVADISKARRAFGFRGLGQSRVLSDFFIFSILASPERRY